MKPAHVHLSRETGLGREADQREVRSTEGEGDRVGTLLSTATHRPDHPHPALRADLSHFMGEASNFAGEVSNVAGELP